MHMPRTRSICIVVSLCLAYASFGCASSSKSTRSGADRDRKQEETTERTPEAPTPDELAESPCGNPNWAQLPDQHEEDGDPDSDKRSEETSKSKQAAEPDP